uniref:Uncharacterized protein n=1 Tax=Cacopsylla melanoneura TaxID=428564 RepID=A0A8D8U515_9HEMI
MKRKKRTRIVGRRIMRGRRINNLRKKRSLRVVAPPPKRRRNRPWCKCTHARCASKLSRAMRISKFTRWCTRLRNCTSVNSAIRCFRTSCCSRNTSWCIDRFSLVKFVCALSPSVKTSTSTL